MSNLGFIVPEQVWEDALGLGLAQIDAAFAGGTIDELLGRIYRNIDTTERDKIKSWLSEHSIPIVENYPREPQDFPCWAVLLSAEEQSQQYTGDTLAQVTLDTGETVTARAERWASTTGVITYAEHPELVKWLHHLAKWIVFDARDAIFLTFGYGIQVTGRDLGFEPRFLQAGRFVYQRGLFIRGLYDQTDGPRDDVSDITDADTASTAELTGVDTVI